MPAFASLPPVLAAGGITDLNPGLTLWTAITFVFLLIVLSRFAWGPIVKMLNERERTIKDAIEVRMSPRAVGWRAEPSRAAAASLPMPRPAPMTARPAPKPAERNARAAADMSYSW